MTDTSDLLFPRESRSDWLRLRTLILLRWMAITGQIAAIGAASLHYQITLPVGLCLLVIGTSVIANLFFGFVYPGNTRLTQRQALLTFLFDLAQLTALLTLAGGLTNPFALLILAPVAISAAVLEARVAALLGLVAVVAVSVMARIYVPLRLPDGTEFTLPALFAFGFWLSLVIGILFLGVYSFRVTSEARSMQDALLATQMALAREQKLTDLGGVVAAAAHELGTPLATIKLVSSELMEELADDPDLAEDAQLIRDQADRCRDILRSMGQAGKDDKQMLQAPLGTVLREAGEPHLHRGKEVCFALGNPDGAVSREPIIRRTPEVIHGLRNLIQNAVDFAESTVWVEGQWSGDSVTIRIIDDGPGYPAQMIGRLGDPFLRKRASGGDAPSRPGYEGMGLGLFIAKTLLERTGAELSFANGSDPFLAPNERPERRGAIVEVLWRQGRLLAPQGGPLGENAPIVG